MAEIKPDATFSVEKSEELAGQIQIIALYMFSVDWEYAARVVKKFRDQAGWQETLAMFKPGHRQEKNDLLRLKAEALNKFVEADKLLREITELEEKIENGGDTFAEIARMFV